MSYSKHTYQTGDTLTAADLNHGEEGIQANDTKKMTRATYDSDNDGIVDDAEKLGNQAPSYYAKASDLALEDKYQKLLNDNVPNTTQTYTFTDGAVSQILHKSGNTTVRTDVFTYATGSITEQRTLGSGEKLTIVTNLETLETAVTYTAA